MVLGYIILFKDSDFKGIALQNVPACPEYSKPPFWDWLIAAGMGLVLFVHRGSTGQEAPNPNPNLKTCPEPQER